MHVHIDISGKVCQRGHSVIGFVSENRKKKKAIALSNSSKVEAGVYNLTKYEQERVYLKLLFGLIESEPIHKVTLCNDYPRCQPEFLISEKFSIPVEDLNSFKKRTGKKISLANSFVRSVRRRLKKFKNIYRRPKYSDYVKVLTTEDILAIINEVK